MFSGDYSYSFKDPASAYAYHLFSVHHDIMWFIIMILILVYWMLYKIIKDFNWKIFNKQQGFILYIKDIHIKVVFSFIVFLFHKFYLTLVYLFYDHFEDMHEKLLTINEDSNLFIRSLQYISKKKQQFRIYRFNLRKKILRTILGVQHSWYPRSFFTIEGLYWFNQEVQLLDPKYTNRLTYRFHLNNKILEIFSQNWSAWLNTALKGYIETNLYHYTSNGFFFNGYINSGPMAVLKDSNYYDKSTADLGFTALASILKPEFYASIKRREINKIFNDFTNLRHCFFESQDFKHSLSFEVIWAIFPTSIIIAILIPSLYLLYSLDDELDPKYTIKVIGHQWYWSYEFNNWIEQNENFVKYNFHFDSNILPLDELNPGDKRLLETDYSLIVPVNVTLRFLITSSDVLHSWAVPQLGIKIDAVPGRLNQFISFITIPGIFYGQCSEICGASHGFMPIVVVAYPEYILEKTLEDSNLSS